jgi:hypothetical protein
LVDFCPLKPGKHTFSLLEVNQYGVFGLDDGRLSMTFRDGQLHVFPRSDPRRQSPAPWRIACETSGHGHTCRPRTPVRRSRLRSSMDVSQGVEVDYLPTREQPRRVLLRRIRRPPLGHRGHGRRGHIHVNRRPQATCADRTGTSCGRVGTRTALTLSPVRVSARPRYSGA